MGYKVQLLLGNNYKIKIKSNSGDYIKKMKKEFALHVKNYFWSGKYKAGLWDGKVHFITDASFMPYGLLLDFLRKHKELFPDIKIEADDGIKNLFKGPELDIKFDLSLSPRPYQKESVELTLKRSKGIIRSATASGKSLVISYIIKNLLDNRATTKVQRALVVVPSTQLVEQFRNDMIDYGIPGQYIGRVYTGHKDWDMAIVISTWQTLKNNLDKIKLYDCMIGDECHQNKAHELKKIFSKSRARYRLGFTGTLPNDVTELYNIKSYLGPVLAEYPSGLLAEQGYIAKCNVKALSVNHDFVESNTYHGIKEEVFNNRFRLKMIADIVNKADHNILLLVSYIAEGDKLLNLINRYTDKDVIFLSGKDSTSVREEWRQKMMNQTNICLIATYGIFQQGINIPNLQYGMLASPTKSKIRTLQSVGRTLRAHESKTNGATIIDIIDEVKFLGRHGARRLEYYESEGFDIKIIEVYETSLANAIAACFA